MAAPARFQLNLPDRNFVLARNSLNPGDRNTSPHHRVAVPFCCLDESKSALDVYFDSLPPEYQDKLKSAFDKDFTSLHRQAEADKLKSAFGEDYVTEGETSSAVQLQGSGLDVGAFVTSAGVHSFPLEQCLIDVVEKVLDHRLNNDTHDPLSQSTLDKFLVWFKENFSRDVAIRDPTLLKTLFGSDVFLSAGMISKYTPGSLLVEILQSLAIGSAVVGVIATATGLYLIFRQRRSLPFGFEREVSIQTLEDVGITATCFAFIGAMSLLLPNNISRCIVVGVLCAVLFFIIIFAKVRPEREAKTEPTSSSGPAIDPIKVGTELAKLSETISSLGEC